MSDMTPISALGGVARSQGLAIAIKEAGLQGMVTLRGDFSDPAMREAAEAAAGVAAPETRKVVRSGDRALAWMAPDELLLLLPYAEADAAAAAFEAKLEGRPGMAVTVSDARALFRLTGEGAREVIAKGAPVDLSRAAFGPGDLRRSHLGQLAAAFWQVSESPEVFEVICFRSVAGYVFDWLVDSAEAETLPGVL
jgi:sarcosine oxidase subunit gamma